MNLDQIIDMINIGIVVIDKDLKVRHWNRWMETHSKIPADKISGVPLFRYFPGLDTPRFNRNFKSVLTFGNFSFFSQKLHNFLFPFKIINSPLFGYQYMQQNCTMSPLRDKNNRISHAVITVSDVTAIAVYERKLMEMNYTDPLTELYNRRYLLSRLQEEFGKYKRYSKPFSIIMFDIDFFKLINDTYGHQCGDYMLQSFANVFNASIRSTDVLARYGGEEFCCLCPETNIESAKDLGERLRKKTEESTFAFNEKNLKITVSGGVAETKNGIPSVEFLLEKADKALYIAKKSGRNRIVAMT